MVKYLGAQEVAGSTAQANVRGAVKVVKGTWRLLEHGTAVYVDLDVVDAPDPRFEDGAPDPTNCDEEEAPSYPGGAPIGFKR